MSMSPRSTYPINSPFSYPIPGFLAYSSHPLIELQVFLYLKNILLYVLTHDDVWIKPSYWFDVILQSRNL